MPGRTTSTATKASKTFQLPAFEFKFGSLTEGTNIPPPPPSPIKEEKPELPVKKTAEPQANGAPKANGAHPATTTTENAAAPAVKTATGGTKRPAEDLPMSPTSTSSTRPGSIRRLFSRNLLNRDFANAEQASTGGDTTSTRPASRSNGSLLDDKKAKRSSGWFRRLSTRDAATSKRTSQLYSTDEAKKPKGPPPPMIPELHDLESKIDVQDGGSLGSDLFSNIKIPE